LTVLKMPPTRIGRELFCQRLDVVEGEIAPGTGAVEEEFDHGVSFFTFVLTQSNPEIESHK